MGVGVQNGADYRDWGLKETCNVEGEEVLGVWN